MLSSRLSLPWMAPAGVTRYSMLAHVLEMPGAGWQEVLCRHISVGSWARTVAFAEGSCGKRGHPQSHKRMLCMQCPDSRSPLRWALYCQARAPACHWCHWLWAQGRKTVQCTIQLAQTLSSLWKHLVYTSMTFMIGVCEDNCEGPANQPSVLQLHGRTWALSPSLRQTSGVHIQQ